MLQKNHIGSLNWGYRVALKDKSVEYQNAYATFIDAHTLRTVTKRGKEGQVTAKYILVATGGECRVMNQSLIVSIYRF